MNSRHKRQRQNSRFSPGQRLHSRQLHTLPPQEKRRRPSRHDKQRMRNHHSRRRHHQRNPHHRQNRYWQNQNRQQSSYRKRNRSFIAIAQEILFVFNFSQHFFVHPKNFAFKIKTGNGIKTEMETLQYCNVKLEVPN